MSSIKIRTKRQGEITLIRLLIEHPMETGRRREKDHGDLIPAHFIEHLSIQHNGKTVLESQFTTAISRDPYLSVRLRNGQSGDRIRVSWQDNLGLSDQEEITLP